MTFTDPTPMRDGFGKALLRLGESNPEVVCLTADLSEAVRVHWFAEKYPERFFQMGISENDMIGTAAGLALAGKIPFATTFGIFATSLAHQPVRLSVGYNHANVKIATSHNGVTVGADGATHQAIEDISLMRGIPGMTVLVPADANEAYQATLAAAAYRGPVYLRLGRIPTPVFTPPEAPFLLERAVPLTEGRDVAIIACGMMVSRALDAAVSLSAEGIKARVINSHTIKPLDRSTLLAAARECGCVVTAEEHSIIGGLGSAVSELLATEYPAPVEMVGVRDTFGESGEPEEILTAYGLTAADIERACRTVISRRRTKNT